jgi:subtilisin family serine protease
MALGALGAALRSPQAAQAPVLATAALGTVVTATVALDNLGHPAGTALLYEALEPGASAARTLPPHELRVPLPEEPGPIAPALSQTLAQHGTAPFIIYLADQADLSAAAVRPDWNERGAAVVDILRRHAAESQAALLAGLGAAGQHPTSFWIVNAIGVAGDLALAQWAAAQPGVVLVAADEVHALEDPAPAQAVDAAGVAWGVERVGAPTVWSEWGVRGAGIVVATIDTGAAYTHTALLQSYRGWSAGGVDHNYNWFDAAGEPPKLAPVDNAGHGTHVLGTLVGRAAGTYASLGMAPDARWIAARACAGLFCTDTALIAAAQWLLAPTNLAGDNPRPDLRPHIINNSWGKSGEDDWYTGYVQAWNASGIFSVFANGNSGAVFGCGSSGSPGQYAEAFAVGATDDEDFIGDFSSRGPTSDSRIKPDLSAPGVAVVSAWPGGGVHTLSGTSMATPHVAGAAALLWSANPALVGDLPATRAALTSSALPLTSPECGPSPTAVPNNVYGWGRLDARQAVQDVRVDVPWLSVPTTATLPANGTGQAVLTFDARQVSAPGTYTARLLVSALNVVTSVPVTFEVQAAANTALVTGALTNHWTGSGVYGRVQVGVGPTVWTDPGGGYTVTLPYGSYALTAAATGYLSATNALDVAGPASSDFVLMPDLPHVALISAEPYSATLAFGERYTGTATVENLGPRPLTITASVPPLEWAIDAAGTPLASLFDISSAPALPLADDQVYTYPLSLGFSLPIYGQLVSEVYLSSNGWVSAQPVPSALPLANCLDAASLPGAALAAFWTDLDPSAGGAVRAAAVDAETFVISFENVPPWRETPDPSGPTYTFEIVLHASGEVDYLFGDMGELPARWAMGMSRGAGRSQSLACYKAPQDLAHQRWTAHNQPPANLWLSPGSPVTVVAPGGSATVDLVLKGLGYVPWLAQPFQGQLRLATNDPSQPLLSLEARAIVGPPAVTLWLPVVRR